MAPNMQVSARSGLFHTFQGVTPRKHADDQHGKARTHTVKRITTPHACDECKRRKIRCDGQQPCGQCLSSRAPKHCFYDKHRQRVIPSRKTLEALSTALDDCRAVLGRLFPAHDVQDLQSLTRSDLLALLDRDVDHDVDHDIDIDHVTPTSALPSPPLDVSPLYTSLQSPVSLASEHALASLDHAPGQAPGLVFDWDDDAWYPGEVQLPLAGVDRTPSSLAVAAQVWHSGHGGSSVDAVLAAVHQLQPHLASVVQDAATVLAPGCPVPAESRELRCVAWSWKAQTLVDAYFAHAHALAPMLDETAFRADFADGTRNDAPWLALLNVVLAVGSVAAAQADNTDHFTYYNRAMEHLALDALDSTHVETVQALAVLGGYYLPHIGRPGMARAVLGAAARMASTIGLDHVDASARGRTWWGLFCLDTWAAVASGRSSAGRWAPDTTETTDRLATELELAVSSEGTPCSTTRLFSQHIWLCQIAIRVQDTLAAPLSRSKGTRGSLDTELAGWCKDLSPSLAPTTRGTVRVMHWRCLHLRMLLHRPALLWRATSTNTHQGALETDTTSVETCRALARELVHDIACTWAPNQVSGTIASSLVYEAALVPLVSVFAEPASSHVPDWQAQVESALSTLEAMEPWSPAARRSHTVVGQLYEAAQHAAAQHAACGNTVPALQSAASIASIGIDFDPDVSMLSLLDQHEFWELDSTLWLQDCHVHAGPATEAVAMDAVDTPSVMYEAEF